MDYKEGGWLPQFPCRGNRARMTGSLIDSVFGDAAAGLKGVRESPDKGKRNLALGLYHKNRPNRQPFQFRSTHTIITK